MTDPATPSFVPNIFRRLPLLLAALLAAMACHDSTAPENAGPLWIVGHPVTTDHDTIDTELPGALVVAVFDTAGKPLRQAAVRIGAAVADTAAEPTVALYFAYPGSTPPWWQALVAERQPFPFWLTTDSTGQLSIPIKLGQLAGRVGVRLSVVGQEATSTYTVWFNVHPGGATRVRLAPRDTVLYAERSYQLRPRVVDRYDNPRGEVPDVAGDSAAVALATTGLATGRSLGRARFRATWHSLADTAWASVVPHGTLAAVTSYPSRVVMFDLDGSEYHTVGPQSVGYISWAPSGARMAVQDNGGATPYCYYEGFSAVLDLSGNERQLAKVDDCSNFMEAQRTPRFSHDETWIYFERARYASGAGSFGPSVYRVHPDATGLQAVMAPDGTTILDGMHPAPSPSGRYLVYSVYVPFPTIETRVFDTSTGQVAAISGVDGAMWMKGSDTLLAFRSMGTASIVLLRPDGSEVRSVPYGFGWSGAPPYDVSPDGRWLVVQRNGFELVSLESGMVLPLTFTIGLGAPAWRP